MIEPFAGKYTLIKTIYLFIYLFHMPVFIMISGYFARNKNNLSVLFRRIIKPYIFFQILYTLLNFVLFNTKPNMLMLIKPWWVLWFLFSLFLWNIILPYLRLLNHPITFTIILALAAGYINLIGYNFSLSRTIVFLPFFVAGSLLPGSLLIKRPPKPIIIFAFSVMLSLFCLLYHLSPHLDSRWLYGCASYSLLNHPEWYAGLYRLLIYLLSFITSICFLSLIPNSKNILTKIGSKTISIYLFHAIPIRLLLFFGFFSKITSLSHTIFLFIIAILIYLGCSANFLKSFVNKISNYKVFSLTKYIWHFFHHRHNLLSTESSIKLKE